jgi:molybdenum cofactor guanylyltransferase
VTAQGLSLDASRLPVTGAVLAGGRSRRMGRDKALVLVGGQPLVTRATFALADVCSRVLVVANDAQNLADVDLPPNASIIADTVPFQGPLGGLATALAAAETEWVFAVGVDMPFLSADVLRVLWKELREVKSRQQLDAVQAVMPTSDAGPEPLLSLYRTNSLTAVRNALAEGSRRVVDLSSRIHVLSVPIEVLKRVDPNLDSLINVNTANDLESARDVANERASVAATETEGLS